MTWENTQKWHSRSHLKSGLYFLPPPKMYGTCLLMLTCTWLVLWLENNGKAFYCFVGFQHKSINCGFPNAEHWCSTFKCSRRFPDNHLVYHLYNQPADFRIWLPYLTNACQITWLTWSQGLGHVPSRLVGATERAFSMIAPCLWNSLQPGTIASVQGFQGAWNHFFSRVFFPYILLYLFFPIQMLLFYVDFIGSCLALVQMGMDCLGLNWMNNLNLSFDVCQFLV